MTKPNSFLPFLQQKPLDNFSNFNIIQYSLTTYINFEFRIFHSRKELAVKTIIIVKPLSWFAKLANILMKPLMYIASGTFKESPQRAHRWNNTRLTIKDVGGLDKSEMVHCAGIKGEMHSRWLFIYHIPILGGWRNYVVLEPIEKGIDWHVGCITSDMIMVSRVKLQDKVRMLVSSKDVSFFGINAATYEQIPITELGRGRIGSGGKFAKEKLL